MKNNQIENDTLTREELLEFRRLVLKNYGIKLTMAETEEQAMMLVRTFELLINNPPPRHK